MQSKHKSDYGEWKLTAGNFYGDAEKDKGKYIDDEEKKKMSIRFDLFISFDLFVVKAPFC